VTFLQKTAIDLLTRHVKDDASAEAVIREHLGVFLNERSNMIFVDTPQDGVVPEISYIDPDLVELIGKREERDEEWFENHLVTRANIELAKSFKRVDERKPFPMTHQGFVLRHFENGAYRAHDLDPEPGFRPATLEESAAFVRKYPLISVYFSLVVLGSEWRHIQYEIPAHAVWRKDSFRLRHHRSLGEDSLLLMTPV
jgi:hypothetical protein